MGYKAFSKKALVPGSQVKVMFGVHEIEGEVLSFDDRTPHDHAVVIETNSKTKERAVVPLHTGIAVLQYVPSKDLLKQELEENKTKKLQTEGDRPK